MSNRRISIVTFPSTDRAFAIVVRRDLSRYLAAEPDEPTTERFEQIVRERFPAARVRARDSLAEFSEHQPAVWYVQREAGSSPSPALPNGHDGRIQPGGAGPKETERPASGWTPSGPTFEREVSGT